MPIKNETMCLVIGDVNQNITMPGVNIGLKLNVDSNKSFVYQTLQNGQWTNYNPPTPFNLGCSTAKFENGSIIQLSDPAHKIQETQIKGDLKDLTLGGKEYRVEITFKFTEKSYQKRARRSYP